MISLVLNIMISTVSNTIIRTLDSDNKHQSTLLAQVCRRDEQGEGRRTVEVFGGWCLSCENQ